jgi:hypothetical protein
VVLHEEHHQVGVLLRQAVAPAEAPRIRHAERRMVAASPLGDVVEQRGDIQQPAALEAAHQLAAQRELMRELRHGEAAQVAQHHQDVLVDRVDVIEVVLHLADDAPELRQVAAQHVVLVHAAELVHDAARLLQDAQEQQLRHRVAPQARVHAPARAPERAQRAGGHAAQVAVLLHEQEALQNRARLPLEQILAARLQQGAARLEAFVQHARRRALRRREARFQVLQQNRIELHDRLGIPVIILHQEFARAPRLPGGVAAFGRERVLVVEGDAVLAAAGEVVQADAQVLQHRFVAREAQRLSLLQQVAARQVAPVLADAAGERDPADYLQVAQAARSLFEVGLQRERRVAVLGMALLLLQLLRLQEGPGLDHALDRALKALEQRRAAGDQPRLQQRGLDGDVGPGRLDASLDRAHAVADLQSDVPEHAHQALQALALLGLGVAREQDQHIHVGVGIELAAPVTAGGQQRGPFRRSVVLPERPQRAIDQARMLAQQPGGLASLEIGLAQSLARRSQVVPAALRSRNPARPMRPCALQPAMPGGGGGEPAETVSTSYPRSVTSTVCSHWADRL